MRHISKLSDVAFLDALLGSVCRVLTQQLWMNDAVRETALDE